MKRIWSTAVLVALVMAGALAVTATATDNSTGRAHWAVGYAQYRIAAYTFPANWTTAIVNAASKWHNQTDVNFYRYADVGHTNWWETSTQILWYGTFPSGSCDPDVSIGCTLVEWSGNNYMVDADTVFDSGNSYTNTCPWWIPAPYDMETVALHEFGHWGTLSESSDSGAVMWGSYWNCRQTLTTHDINSMNALY